MGLKISTFLLLSFQSFEKRLKIPSSETLCTVSFDDFVEQSRSVFHWFCENLKQITFFITIHKDSKILKFFDIFINIAHSFRNHLVISFGRRRKKLYASVFKFCNSFYNVLCGNSNMLNTFIFVEIQIFFYLRFFLTFCRLVDWEFSKTISVGHYF